MSIVTTTSSASVLLSVVKMSATISFLMVVSVTSFHIFVAVSSMVLEWMSIILDGTDLLYISITGGLVTGSSPGVGELVVVVVVGVGRSTVIVGDKVFLLPVSSPELFIGKGVGRGLISINGGDVVFSGSVAQVGAGVILLVGAAVILLIVGAGVIIISIGEGVGGYILL